MKRLGLLVIGCWLLAACTPRGVMVECAEGWRAQFERVEVMADNSLIGWLNGKSAPLDPSCRIAPAPPRE